MKRPALDAAPLLIVRAASLLVPRARRCEWTAEWTSELWHLRHDRGGDPAAGADGAIPISLGAIQDAWWLCRDRLRVRARAALRAGSAARCALVLGALAAAAICACVLMPGARDILAPLPYRDADTLVVISGDGSSGTQAPGIRVADYREWTTDTASLYSQIAFYRPIVGQLHLAHHRTARLSVAVASENLLGMLGIAGASAGQSGPPRLFLARSAWRRQYNGDSGIFGRTAQIDGQSALIAGVIPDSEWRLPGRADAWLLESPHAFAILPPTVRGFVVARIHVDAFPPPRAGWRSMVETRDGVTVDYAIISLSSIAAQPVFSFLCALLLACLALPAVTALALGDYPLSHEPMHRRIVARRWLFLAAKFLLVLTIVLFGSTDLAFGSRSVNLSTGSGIQALTSFLPLLFGFQWILRDQRRRCPVCLRRLSNPARVGQASCNFLSWCGTELICASGHGLLHIPEMPTSWFGTQRWLCLDSSWLCLFADRPAQSPELV